MKKRSVSILILLLLALAPGAATTLQAAPPPKIAVIDLERVMRSYYKSRIAAESLRNQTDIFQAYLNKQAEDLAKLEQSFRIAAANAGNIAVSAARRKKSDEEAAAAAREIKIKRLEIETYTADRKQQLLTLEGRKRREILDDIAAEVRRRAAVEGWTLVLDRAATGPAGLPLVVWSLPGGDLTDSVIEELNRGSRRPAANEKKP